MSIWQRLDIEPTEDLKAIKRAYAKKLKQHHPEDDPEGYQFLREAYDAAIQQAKWKEVHGSNESGQLAAATRELGDDSFGVAVEVTAALLEETPAYRTGLHDQLDQLIMKAEAIYRDFPSRIQLSKWAELLGDDVMWNMEHRTVVSHRIAHFLQEHRNLPRNVWELIESTFHWKTELQVPEADPFMQYYVQQLDGPELSFDIVNAPLAFDDLERFLSLRVAVSQSLRDNKLSEAAQHIDEARTIFDHDPDLTRLHGELLVRSEKPEAALDIFTQLISLQPSKLDGYVGRIRMLHRLERYQQAIKECKAVLDWTTNHLELHYLLGISLKDNGDIEEALGVFEQLHDRQPCDLQVMGIITELRAVQPKKGTGPSQRKGLLANWIHRTGLSCFSLSPARRYRFKPGSGFFFLLCFITTPIFMQVDDTNTQLTIVTMTLQLLSTFLFIRVLYRLFRMYLKSLD